MMDHGRRKPRRQLSPEEKWEVFLEVTSQEISQADAARKYGVDVSVIVRLRALAKDAAMAAVHLGQAWSARVGRGGRAGAAQGRERSSLRSAEGDGDRAHVAPGKAALGLFGPVPARVSAETKLELVGLIDGAVRDGWAHRRACEVLDLADVRAHRWRQRLRDTGSLEDRDPGGGAVHGLLSWEEAEILDLIEEWGQIDRSHRKIAHRGSRLGVVFVSPSTVLRVALKHKVQLPGEPYRPRPVMPALPEIPWERNRIWIWDATHFTRAGRVAYAIVDVVTRYWIGYLLTSEQTSTQAQLLFARALEDQQLLDADGRPPAQRG